MVGAVHVANALAKPREGEADKRIFDKYTYQCDRYVCALVHLQGVRKHLCQNELPVQPKYVGSDDWFSMHC